MNSVFGKLNLLDLGKGLLVAALATVGMALLPVLQSGALPTLENLQAAGISGLAAGLAYLIKNLFTNSAGIPLKKEIPKADTEKE